MSGRREKSPGLNGSLVSVGSPNVLVVDVESAEVTKTGSWTVVSDVDAVGSSYRESAVTNDVLSFSFGGSALWIRFKVGPDCGKATVTIDETAMEVDLYNALDAYKYVSVGVALDETVTHTVTIKVEGTKNPSSSDYKVKVDAYTYRLTEEALSLHSIEYLDLINVINTINKISQITNIGNIDTVNDVKLVDQITNIGTLANLTTVGTVNDVKLIDSITSIGTLDTINDVKLVDQITNIGTVNSIGMINKIGYAPSIANLGVAMNGDFEIGTLAGWSDPGGVATVTNEKPYSTTGSVYSCKLKFSSTYGLIQYYYPPLLIDDIIDCSILTLQGDLTNDRLMVTFYFTDGLAAGFSVPSNSIANDWEHHDLLSQIKATVIESLGYGGKHFYAIKFQNYISGGTAKDTLYIDDYTLLTMPNRLQQFSALFSDVSATTAPVSGSEAKTSNAGYASVTPNQVLTVSFEYKTDSTFNVVGEVHITFFNTDKTVNSEVTITGTFSNNEWLKKASSYMVPDGVAYVGLYGYVKTTTSATRTISLRNIKVFPVTPSVDGNGNLSVRIISTSRLNVPVMPEREDLTVKTGAYSPNGAGVLVIAASGTTKIKIYAAGYHSTVDGNHFLYFGTSTTAPTLPATKVFLASLKAGHYRQTFIQPLVSAAGDALYVYSASAETNMLVDVEFIQE